MKKKMLDTHREVLCGYFTWEKLPEPHLSFVRDSRNWLARRKGEIIEVNTLLTTRCSPELWRCLVVKALIHQTKHGLTNPMDIIACKRAFGDHGLLMFDIEADLIAAQYFHQVRGYSFELLYDILFENMRLVDMISLNRDLRFERFLGSGLSVWWYFEKCEHILFVPWVDNLNQIKHVSFAMLGVSEVRYISRVAGITSIELLYQLAHAE